MSTLPMKKSFFFLVATLAVVYSLPHVSFAQATANLGNQSQPTATNQTTEFVPLAVYDKSPKFVTAFKSKTLADYLNNIFEIVISIGGILAVLRIAYAGYLYMGSAGMWSTKEKAKEMLGDAIIGLLLLFAIYLILNLINPDLLNLNVKLTKVPTSTQTPAVTDDRTTPNTNIPDGTPCTLPNNLGQGLEQGGTCRFAPPTQSYDYMGPTPKVSEFCFLSKNSNNFLCYTNQTTCNRYAIPAVTDGSCTQVLPSVVLNPGEYLNIQDIPKGDWCYVVTSGFFCTQSQSTCATKKQQANPNTLINDPSDCTSAK